MDVEQLKKDNTQPTETREPSDTHNGSIDESTTTKESNDDTQESQNLTDSNSKDAKINKVANDMDMSKDQMIQEILKLKSSISSLTTNIRDTKSVCDKYENDNQYLQDYVGTLMKNNDIKK